MPNPFFEFFKQQWILNNVDSSYIQTQVTKGRLTLEEANEIVNIPRVEV